MLAPIEEGRLTLARSREFDPRIPVPYDHGAGRKGVDLATFSDQYLEWARSQKPSSVVCEECRLKIILEFFSSIGIACIEDITPYQVEQLRTWLKTRKIEVIEKDGDKIIKKEKELARSRTTINRYTQLIRGMIYRAIDWELFKGPNPVRKVKFYRESPEVRAFSPEETKKVLAAAREISKAAQSPAQRAIADIVLLALNTGLRRSEALGLRWRDWQNDELHIRGKGEKQRTVPLNDAARAVLARQPRRGEYIFDIPNRHEPSLFRRAFAQIQKKSGIPFTLHKCRHTFATSLLATGTDIVTISDLLGHSKVMTSLLYSHSSPEKKKMAVDSLGKKKQ